MQHALFLTRTPKIQKLKLQLDKKENEELVATVQSESGLFSSRNSDGMS